MVGFGVGFTVGVGIGVGVGLGVGVGVGIGLGLGLGLGQATACRLVPAVKWTAPAYGTRTRAAGVWLVVKASSPADPG